MVAISVAYKVLRAGHSYLEIGKELELGDRHQDLSVDNLS
jgi:hypothetical protein